MTTTATATRRASSRDRITVIAALVAPIALCAALIPVRQHRPNTDAALILVALVVAVAANGQRVAGVLATLSGAAGFDFLLTQPYQRFNVTARDDVETMILLVVVGLAVTELAVRGRQFRTVASTGASYLARIRVAADLLAGSRTSDDLLAHVSSQLVDVLGLKACQFEPGPSAGKLPQLAPDGSLTWAETRWDVEEFGLPDQRIELPARHAGRVQGRFLLEPTPGTAPSLESRLVALMLANVAGAAVTRSSSWPTPRPRTTA
jgi:K+-sensing histidine kinase KdpD